MQSPPAERIDVAKSEIQTEFTLNLYSLHKHHLTVELKTRVTAVWARVAVAYRVAFVLSGKLSESDRFLAMKELGSQIGPSMLFPFVREAITSVSQKSGMPPLTIPLIDLEQFADIEIPESENEPPSELLEAVESEQEGSGA
jgi:preprotein translocase subunit SecB